ncbi:MAG: hypothetical protein Tsb002_25340 [Wenzhouxiangellaceae bacterium]
MKKAVNHSTVDLVSAIRNGDSSAEAALVKQFQPGLKLMLAAKIADYDAVPDLVQETLSAVIFAIRDDKIREPKRLAGYIQQTALNQIKSFYRKSARISTNQEDLLSSQTADQTTPVTQIQRAQTRKTLYQLLNQLKIERDRELLLRYYLKDEDKETLCKDLSLSAEHFDRVLHRARKRMKALLEEHPEIRELLMPEER